MTAKLYEVLAYTGQWAHRRKFFPTRARAMEWAADEFEESDVCEVWLCVIDTETGDIVENKPIMRK